MLRKTSMIRSIADPAALSMMGLVANEGLPFPRYSTPARVLRKGTPEGNERLEAANEKRRRRQERNLGKKKDDV